MDLMIIRLVVVVEVITSRHRVCISSLHRGIRISMNISSKCNNNMVGMINRISRMNSMDRSNTCKSKSFRSGVRWKVHLNLFQRVRQGRRMKMVMQEMKGKLRMKCRIMDLMRGLRLLLKKRQLFLEEKFRQNNLMRLKSRMRRPVLLQQDRNMLVAKIKKLQNNKVRRNQRK